MLSPRAVRRWPSDTRALVFVWGAWLVLSVTLLQFVRTYGVDFPYYDEWEMVPAITGQQPVTLSWLWSQHNEHRMFLGRLIYLTVAALGGYDFRAGAWFDASVLCASAAMLIAFARRFRGHTSYADAFFPLLMLHWGQAENLVLSFQVQFVASAALAVIVLVLLLRRSPMSTRRALALGLCAVLFPLLGGTGLALTPAIVVCVFLAGWDLRKADPGGRWTSVAVWTLGVLAIALTASYFVNYQRPAKHPHSDDFVGTLNGALQFLTIGCGSAAKTAWPVAKYALLVLSGATGAALIATVAARARDAALALRLLFFIGSVCSLAIGISWARSALSPVTMFSSRYSTLAAPFFCALYLAWEVVDRPQLRRFVQACLFVAATLLLIPNGEVGIQEGILYRDLRAGAVSDLQAGVAVRELVQRHYAQMYYGGADVLVERMHQLHARGIGLFNQLKE